jgi:cytochrome c biogenesis protein CcmG/thiol:disulfide interchange protein DsbE
MLIDKPLPEFTAPPLAGTDMPGFSSSTLADGKAATIINVWASWCVSCRTEHPFLSRLAEKSGARLYGLNYKDTTAAANRFLQRFGNPYIAIGVDKPGRIGIDLGVYGVPETFIISGEGKVIYRHPGPVNDRIIDEVLVPLVRKPKQKG